MNSPVNYSIKKWGVRGCKYHGRVSMMTSILSDLRFLYAFNELISALAFSIRRVKTERILMPQIR